MGIVVGNVAYRHANREFLFEDISFSVPDGRKVAVVGNNGSGKSTLLKILAGTLEPADGTVQCSSRPYYVPQQIDAGTITVAEALGVSEKLYALKAIENGSADPVHFETLADDWAVEERCRAALDHLGLAARLDTPLERLSGGERTKVCLAGLLVHSPEIVLLDEPTNHLDTTARAKLYEYITVSKAAIVIVSHDVALLRLIDTTYELAEKGLRLYGGNYDFYREQKALEDNALAEQIGAEETALKQAQRKAQEVRERQQRRESRGAKTTGVPRIILNARHDKGENTGAKLAEKHSSIIDESRHKLTELRARQRQTASLKIDFDDAALHEGKLLVRAEGVNVRGLWPSLLSVEIRSGERIHLRGDNGSGKTTLIKLLTGELTPETGAVWHAPNFSYLYLDQQYSSVCHDRSILELAREHNLENLEDHAVKTRLNRALFPFETWDKNCLALSGGERMRLALCCLMLSNHVPDMLILDEPTNNLDLASLAILTDIVRGYRGTLVVISHDHHFVEQVGVTRDFTLD